jgi:short subunit dehydrogenase-like uncharacterized protein
MDEFLIYGANGYTGRLITRLAAEKGMHPVLAGRNRRALEQLAAEYGLQSIIFGLDRPSEIDKALSRFSLILNCAGPFSRTYTPVVESCLRTSTHYLDITGEINVFESIASHDGAAADRNIMLLPGVGFDVVPSDCLALHLKQRLPSATKLTLAILGVGRISHGTATTLVEKLDGGGAIRRNGKLTGVPAAWKTREFDFGVRSATAVTIPWGDVATAFYSTGIENIEVYAAIPAHLRTSMRLSRHFGWLFSSATVQRLLKFGVDSQPAGPSDAERANGSSIIWGEVENTDKEKSSARLYGPEGYTLTALTAIEIVRRVLSGDFKPGFQTPALAYGPNLILAIPGTHFEDLPPRI